MQITAPQLVKLGASQANAEKFVNPLNDTLTIYDISTPLRVTHFISQVFHESGSLHYTREIASGEAYEGRRDLGNIHTGDGRKYRGAGLIQITGLNNYKMVSQSLGMDFVNHPELLEKPEWAARSAGWFWNRMKLNEWADKDNLDKITRRINGGLNGLESRTHLLAKAKEIFK